MQALRSKLRNLSQVTSEESVALAEDVKRLQSDLKQLKDVRPAAASATVLDLVRARGIAFMAHDRLLAPDIATAIALVESGEVVAAVEARLGEALL